MMTEIKRKRAVAKMTIVPMMREGRARKAVKRRRKKTTSLLQNPLSRRKNMKTVTLLNLKLRKRKKLKRTQQLPWKHEETGNNNQAVMGDTANNERQ